MSITDSILSGSLSLGQGKSWKGQSVLNELCFYTDESTDSVPIFDVNFVLKAVVNLAAIKLYMFRRDRWRVANVDQNSSLTSFFDELFDEKTNLCGTTKKAMLVQVNKQSGSPPISKRKGDNTQYPLKEKSNIAIYGEKLDSTLFIYAHPLIDDFDFLAIYEGGTTLHPPNEDRNNDQMVLNEMFGDTFEYEDMLSSAQLPLLANKISELDLIREMALTRDSQVASRDLIAEAKNAMEEKKQLIKSKQQPVVTTNRMSKSKPSKYKAPSNVNTSIPYEKLAPEKKTIIKNLIKDTLASPLKENKAIDQLIYSSIRFVYRNIMTSSKPIDEAKLKCIIRMHADFYSNIENVVNLLHPDEE